MTNRADHWIKIQLLLIFLIHVKTQLSHDVYADVLSSTTVVPIWLIEVSTYIDVLTFIMPTCSVSYVYYCGWIIRFFPHVGYFCVKAIISTF